MKKILALILTLAALLGALSVARAEATFRDLCTAALETAATDLELEYQETEGDGELTESTLLFSIDSAGIIAVDATFTGILLGSSKFETLSILQQFLDAYDLLAESTSEECPYLNIALVADADDPENGILIIDESNLEEVKAELSELLAEMDPDDGGLFTGEPLSDLFGGSANGTGESGCPSAFDGILWRGMELTLTKAALAEGNELASLRKDFGDDTGNYIVLSFVSSEGGHPDGVDRCVRQHDPAVAVRLVGQPHGVRAARAVYERPRGRSLRRGVLQLL